MKKICILDLCNKGHHWFYNYTLMKELSKNNKCYYFTSDLSSSQECELKDNNIEVIEFKIKSKNKVYKNIEYFYIFYKLFKFVKKEKINKVLIIYLDDFIYQTWLYSLLMRKINIITTLHWYRRENLKERFIKGLLNKPNVNMIVHSLDIKNKLRVLLTDANTSVINYPIMAEEKELSKEKARAYLNIKTKYPVLLYFGAFRSDKGIDVLIQSLNLLKHKVHLIIAGSEGEVSKASILEAIGKLKEHEFTINIKFIEDSLVRYYFTSADIVTIPYKHWFSGESGVFLEAMNNGRTVVVPNICDFEEKINKYNNGVVFKCEDFRDLAIKIDFAIDNLSELSKNSLTALKYIKGGHSITNFVRKYKEVIE